jgi:nitroreductase
MSTKELESRWSVEEHAFPYGGNLPCRYEFLLRYATLAPSSHNTQPWLFTVTHDEVILYADPTRALPVVDPENRALIISCGAALEYLCVSARHFGYVPHVSFENRAQAPDFLASFSIGERREPDAIENAMFQAIPQRHTNRMKFEDSKVPDETIEQLKTLSDCDNVVLLALTSKEDRADLARLVSEGDRIQASDPKFRRELAAWVHANRSFSNDGMPGYAFGTGDIPSVFGPLVVRTFDWGKGQAAKDEQLVSGSPLLAALVTQHDTQSDWLNTGRALAKILLMITHHGLSASFLNQPIEVSDLRPALKLKLGTDGHPQILLRIGYGPEVKPTPRRPIEEIILNQDA